MAFLTSCWFIIETILIPDGFRKWVCLSFYIHPFFIVFCQLFLWLKFLTKCILVVIFYPLRIICMVCLFVFRFVRDCAIYVFSFVHTRVISPVEVTQDQAERSLVLQSFNQNQQIGVFYCVSSIGPEPCMLKVFEFGKNGIMDDDDDDDVVVLDHEEEKMEEEPTSFEHISSISHPIDPSTKDVDLENNDYHISSGCSSSNSSPQNISDMDYELPPSLISIPSSSMVEREDNQGGDHQEESDGFYNKYAERMRWFDVLNYDRTHGMSAVLSNQIGTPSSVDSNEPVEYFSIPYWSKQTRKKMLRSIEIDFEMVYVAQSCLSWEALHYQHAKVQALGQSGSGKGVFYGNVVGEFQKFQVLLERFLEDERCEGKRIWNYVRRRFALKSLLQVPQISGFLEEEREDNEGEAISIKEVLKAIERCIQAFGVFVRTDEDKRLWWKLKSSLWAYPPVEDPRDLQLLHHLTLTLQKREIWLKDLQGKKRCWFNRVVKPMEESQRQEMFFTMIDMKLVSRVLQMSTISSSQLKWCQEKLQNINFEDGKVFRTCTTAPLIFPPS